MQNDFRRLELKYPVKEARVNHIRSILESYGMSSDNMFNRSGSRDYVVTSLYFDSPERLDYREKSGGYLDRKKLRVRIYEPHLRETQTDIFLEMKMKHDMSIHKIRTQLSLREYNLVVEGKITELLKVKSRDAISSSILTSMLRHRAKPHLVVRYNREPYISSTMPRFRITFDTHIEAGKCYDLRTVAPLHRVAHGTAVMELKYSTFLPTWFGAFIRSFNLSRESFPKYALGFESAHKYNSIPR